MAVHSQVNGTTAIPWRGSRRKRSLLEQLKDCQDAWCPRAPWDRDRAHAAMCGATRGSFLVVRDASSQPSLLCVSTGAEDEVSEYSINCKDAVFQLSESRLSFSDLPQLVLFYSLTRDVLAVCLAIPHWMNNVTEMNNDHLSQLEPKTWLFPPPEQTEEIAHKTMSSMMCSIQLTSSNGAMCIINPLYLHEHGDDWLTQRAPACQQSNYTRMRRLSTTRTWAGSGLQSKRAISLDQEPSAASAESSGLTRARSADYPPTPPTPTTVVLRRPSRDLTHSPTQRASTGSLSTPSTPGNTTPELQCHSSPVPQSPHRVSWIEDGFWLPPPRPSSLLHPPSLELDSLSISSIEEEQDFQMPSLTSHHPSAHRLADKVIHRLSAVGQALGGLICQKKKLTYRVIELSEKKNGAFAEAVRAFVETTHKGGTDPSRATGSEFLQEVRSSLTSLRETLLDYPEIHTLLESITDLNDSEIDSLVELSLHKVALKPVATHLYTCIRTSWTNDGSFEKLQSKQRVLEKNSVEELGGSAGVGVPDSVILEQIQQRWTTMHETYSPNKKVQILLKVCKSIYHGMSANARSGTVFGADDFLPCLTWVLLRSDLATLQVDTDYMMELLDPAQLQGEGGYYLTTLYASLYYISSFQERLAVRQLSVEAQHSINQWHRRRTLHCNQSRRSKHRRTIRRQAGQEKHIDALENETESNTKALQWERKDVEQELADQSPTSPPALDCQPETQQEDITSKQEDGLSPCVEAEEDQEGV
ncbi:ras and Rab interactor 2 isoform 2-T2 [Menidia menidia]|uniref:(Atlantic silverside) hypothetical protein n=1 Tax=Menidia menidia TaxID=238744 RepID=A0A8S4BL37_9TELE|nr:unnamed protein product [Menidia menidia]